MPGGALVAFLVAALMTVSGAEARMSGTGPVVEPEVRTLVSSGHARVIVVLHVDETSDPDRRAEAIGRAQEAVLSRLSQPHASVLRQYTSVPMLALEIDAVALRALETMTGVVAGVRLDRVVTPQ